MEKDTVMKYTGLELAKILGEPRDPRKPYTLLQTTVCETATAEPEDYVYSFDVLQDTDKIYTITSTGELTQESVTPDSPALLTFIDIASPEYYVRITDLAKKKEDVLARKTTTINRAMNAYENRLIVAGIDGAVQTAKQFGLNSGATTFQYSNLVDMLDSVIDFGDRFVLIAGTAIAKDIVLWDWTDNKYQSLKAALEDLNVEIIRINQTVTIDGSSTPVIASDKAYLVATDTEVGKPVLFVRKKLDSIAMLGGVLAESGDQPERLIITSHNPVTVLSGSKRFLAVGVTGYEELVVSVINPYALACFTRA
jgi:hypothetical protein